MVTVVSFQPSTREFSAVEEPPQGSAELELPVETLRLRVLQQEMLSIFGVLALKGTPFPELLDHAARLVADGLKAEFAKVLKYQPEDNRFLVCSGVGWGPEVVGKATVGADMASPAGYALRTGKPVISNHLDIEERFRTPELLVEHGIRRAMNVILQGDGTPYGVLEVDSRSEGEFIQSDIIFLQGVANILGMAIERQRIEGNLRQALDRQQLLVKEVNHRVNNSLSIVASMLHLHASVAGSSDVRHELREASSRIAAIARAHQRFIGRLLALDSEPAHWCLYPLARVARGRRGPRWIILRDAPAALAAGGAKGSSPTNGRSRGTVMVARALNLLLKGSAAPGDPKIASALNLHLKVLRVAQICSSHAHARRSEKSPVH